MEGADGSESGCASPVPDNLGPCLVRMGMHPTHSGQLGARFGPVGVASHPFRTTLLPVWSGWGCAQPVPDSLEPKLVRIALHPTRSGRLATP